MLITKFNKMIRNKFIWGFIAVVISVFFVLSFSSMRGCSPTSPDTIGKLYGEEVSQRALRTAMFFELGMQSDRGLGQEEYANARQRTWQRLAVLRTAEKLGLLTPDAEVARAIMNEPGFAPNGAYDDRRYKEFVRQRGVDPQTFEEFLRQDLTMQKIRSVLDSVVWTAPSEVDQRLRNLTDEREVTCAVFDRSNFKMDVEISDEEMHEFFAGNEDLFTIPERVRVRYVSFPYVDYVSTNVNEADLLGYYNDNIDDYTPETTNEFEFPIPLPLDEVRDDIAAIIQQRESVLAAKDAATDFVIMLPPDRRGRQPSFEDAATTTGLTVRMSGPFAIDEPVSDLGVDERFTAAAFRLIPNDPESYFSDAILASNAAYVIAFHEKQAPRVSAFEEVEADLMPLAMSNKLATAFEEHVDSAHDALEESTMDASTFKMILEGYDASVTTAVFSVYSSLLTNAFPHQDLLVSDLVELETGDISDVIRAEDVALIAHMGQRTPTDPAESYSLRGQLMRTLQGYRADILFTDYSEYLLDVAGFEDLQAPQQPAAEGETEETEPAGSGTR